MPPRKMDSEKKELELYRKIDKLEQECEFLRQENRRLKRKARGVNAPDSPGKSPTDSGKTSDKQKEIETLQRKVKRLEKDNATLRQDIRIADQPLVVTGVTSNSPTRTPRKSQARKKKQPQASESEYQDDDMSDMNSVGAPASSRTLRSRDTKVKTPKKLHHAPVDEQIMGTTTEEESARTDDSASDSE